MPSDTGDTGASETMRGWKFLERGRVAPFGGHTWPAPGNGAPGEWIQPPGGEVFACRILDLPWWVNAELWEVELAAPLRTLATQIVGHRGRLLRRMVGWDDSGLRAYGVACADRAREAAASLLVQERRTVDADALRRARGPLELYRVAQGMTTDAASPGAMVVGYLAAAALRAAEGSAAAAAHHAADAAAIADGTPGALQRELEWQARWIVERAGLPAPVVAV